MTRYKHIIWDWNGTLLNDTWLCVKVLNDLHRKQGLAEIDEAIYRENFSFPVIEFYNWLGFDTSEEKFKQLSHEFISGYEAEWLKTCKLHAETVSTLIDIDKSGITQSVLSAAKQEALEIGINHFDIANHFIGLVGIDNIYADGKVSQGKSWIKQLPFKPTEVVLIGDTLHDLEVANAIGCDAILISHGHNSRKRLVASGATVVDSWQALLCQL